MSKYERTTKFYDDEETAVDMANSEVFIESSDAFEELQLLAQKIDFGSVKNIVLRYMESSPHAPLIDWGETYSLFEDPAVHTFLNFLRGIQPTDLGFVNRVDMENQPDTEVVPIEQFYIGADGKEHRPLTKYLPTHVLQAYESMNDSYKKYLADLGIVRPGLVILSGYRSPAHQALVFANNVADMGLANSIHRVFLPGHSEHNDMMYTAVDFTCIGDENGSKPDPNGKGAGVFEDFMEFDWLIAHAEKYGFVTSFFPDPLAPYDKYTADGFDYEPWHFRYLGDKAADFMSKNNVHDILQARTKLMNKV